MTLCNFFKPFTTINPKIFCRYIHISRNSCNLPELINDITENVQGCNSLQKSNDDLSTIRPYLPDTFNLAAYVNKSETLQNLVHLGVNLSNIEKKPHLVEKVLKLNFEEDIKHHLMFLKDYVEVEEIGLFLTKNLLILCEDLENLEVRVNYLSSKRFKHEEISRIISKNPFWLMFSTVRIDTRLGFYQQKFDLCGNEVRLLATKQPNLITYNLEHVKINTFVIKEEMGFEANELKKLILSKPKLWMINQKSLLQRFNYVHNVIKIPHARILNYPNILLCRNFKIKQRHTFLEKLGRAQYDPTIANFIPLNALTEETDIEFCKKYAKCHVDDFNTFLKTI